MRLRTVERVGPHIKRSTCFWLGMTKTMQIRPRLSLTVIILLRFLYSLIYFMIWVFGFRLTITYPGPRGIFQMISERLGSATRCVTNAIQSSQDMSLPPH